MTVNNPDPFEPDRGPDPLILEAVKPRPRSSNLLNLALGAAVVIAIAGVAFAVGRGTASAAAATVPGARGAAGVGNGAFPGGGPNASGGPGGGFRGGGNGLSIEGTVTAVDAGSVTITTSAGTTVQLSIDGSTEYHQQAPAASSDVKTGSTVVVQVSGFPGRGGQPGASASPAPSAGTGGTTGTATDITVVP